MHMKIVRDGGRYEEGKSPAEIREVMDVFVRGSKIGIGTWSCSCIANEKPVSHKRRCAPSVDTSSERDQSLLD